jgi:hypothetical protein
LVKYSHEIRGLKKTYRSTFASPIIGAGGMAHPLTFNENGWIPSSQQHAGGLAVWIGLGADGWIGQKVA